MDILNILKQNELKGLIETSAEWCVSIYLTIHKTGREQQQDPIRLKNLIAKAETQLLAHGVRRPDVQALLQPAENLLNDGGFWKRRSDGLAIFLAPGVTQIYRLPAQFEELVVISNKFHIKPLLPLLSKDGQFYILAIGLQEMRLFLASRFAVEQFDLGETPTSMQEAFSMDDPERYLGAHQGIKRRTSFSGQKAMFYGQSVQSDEEEKKDILRFFQYFDAGLRELVVDETLPMLSAGLAYLLPIYRQANTYAGLLEESVEVNVEEMDEKDIHRLAWEAIKPHFQAEQQESREQFEQYKGQQNELASTDLEAVVKAARFGRVDTLFVPLNVQVWGRFDAKGGQVRLDDKAGPENEDLLDYAAVQTLIHSGKVFAVPPEKIPGGGTLAAILRYPASGASTA